MSFWLPLACVAVGLLGGIGAVTFGYAEGLSYLSSDPAACANCHIMWPQYTSWQKSSHHTVAGCVDCHLPREFVAKYLAKAENGWNHSRAFTLQDFHEPIFIRDKNARVLQESCLACHGDLVHAQAGDREVEAPRCTHCHATVGHGERVGVGGPLETIAHPGGPS